MNSLRCILRSKNEYRVTFSTTSCLKSRNRKRRPKFLYSDKYAFRANNWLINRYEQPDLYEDYPLGYDQRASWKHWRWFDPFYKRWVDNTPNPTKKEFDPNFMERRQMIHEQDSIQMKFALLLDKDRKKKYVTPCFNMEFVKNLSYFYQYLTNTKFVHGLPYNIDSTTIEESEIEEFEQFLASVLQTECKYNDMTCKEKIRIKEPLKEFSPWMDEFMLSGELPYTDHLPYVYGMNRLLYRNTITPGFRFKGGDIILNYDEAYRARMLSQLPPPVHDPHPYGHTQFISLPESFSMRSYEANLEHCDITDQIEEHIKGHGIMSGWTWSAAQAHYEGHWMDNDVEKPFCVQTVVSDGSHFAFFCYQLNTVSIDPENVRIGGNERRNLCYGTQFMKLFDVVDGTDDIVLHRDATTLLLKFMKNNSTNVANAEDNAQHNVGLDIQEWDPERPHIELQVPRHVREKTAALEIAKQEEMLQNRTWAKKFIDWVKT